MKCCIVTVYKTQNCGSFLQAYALGKALERYNQDVCYLNYNEGNAGSKYVLAVKQAIKGKLRLARNTIEQKDKFQRCWDKLQIVNDTSDCDLILLGSDTIWDISREFFQQEKALFWGRVFGKQRVISYAPSLGYARKEAFQDEEWLRSTLRNLERISVREYSAKQLLQPYTEQEIQVVCDPTLLVGPEAYNEIAGSGKDDKPVLFLYHYGRLPAEYIKEIQELARREDLKVVSFGAGNPWTDEVKAYDPAEFVRLYREAKYIVTNTFHGAVFSHIFEKRFAVIHNEKPKIIDLLERLGTSDKSTKSGKNLSSILHSGFDYQEVRQRIEKEREASLKFLKSVLGDVK